MRHTIGLGLLAVLMAGCADVPAEAPSRHHLVGPSLTAAAVIVAATQPAGAPATQPEGADPAWPGIARVLERSGIGKDGIYTIRVPRDDLDVSIDGMGIPTGAGIESVFHFYRCPCGKMNVAGQFVVCDYEANDVVDALRKNAGMNVVAIAPFLLYSRPNLMLVRFQAEGDPNVMAGILREALRWTGKERMAPDPLPRK